MKIGFFLTNSNEGFYNWNQIEKSLFLDAPSIQKGFGHKYIKRFPKKSGIGYNYIYPEDMFRPFKTLLEFFGVKEKKIKDDYEKEGIKKDYGVDQKTYAMHVLEFFTNKEKWNTIFANKAKRDQYKKPVNQNVLKLTNSIAEKKADEQIKTAKKDKERGTALLQKKNSMLNRSLMRKVWGIYSVEGQRVEAEESEAEKTANRSNAMKGNKNAAENGVFNDSPKTERDNITKEKIKNDYLNRITSIDKKTGEKTFKYDDGRLIKMDQKGNVLYDSLFDQAEPELKATSRKEIEQTAKNVFDTVKNTSNPTFDNASKIIDDIAVKTNMNMVDAAKVKEEVSKLFDKEKEIDEQAVRDYAADVDKEDTENDNSGNNGNNNGNDGNNNEDDVNEAPKVNMKSKGESEWGTVYEMENGTSLDAAKFLVSKKDGLVENAFVGKDKTGRYYEVGLCWGHDRFGLQKIIEKHIVKQSDFENLEEAISTINKILINGNEKFKKNDKIQIDNGKYRLILDKTTNNKLVLTVFDNSRMDLEKIRPENEQELKRKELVFVDQNTFTQDGTPLPETVSNIYNITETENVNSDTSKLSDAMMGNQNAKKFSAAIDAMISDISSKLDSIRTSTIYSDKQKNALLRDTYSELTKPIVDIAIMNSADRDMAISTVKDIVELLRSKVPESEKELIRNDLNWENIIDLRNSSGDVPFKSENNKKPEEYSKTNNAALSQTEKNILALALEYEKRQDPTMSLLWYAEKVRNKFPELVSKLDNWTEIENIKFGDINVQEIKDYAESVDKEENESTKDITKINNDFNDDIENFKSGNLNEKYKFKLGKPSEILLKCGFPNDDIELLAKQLKLKMSIHNFSADDIKDLPLALQNPLAVFSYGDAKKSQNVIVNLNKDGKNFVVGIHFNQVNGQISDIRGLFNKDNQEWLNWINQGKARYLNKNKLQELINQQRTNLAEVEYLDLKPIENILQQNPAVNDLFLEDDYIEKMNRHNAMLGNQNAKKDFTEEQQKEYDKTKKWNEDYIAESDQEVKEELLKDQLDTVDNPDKDARTKAKFEAIKDLYEETSGKKYEKKTVKPQTTDEMKKEQKKEKEARKKAGLPNPGNNVGDRVSAIDDADTWNPNSENYRFKDTGYIAGSRKELASMFIMERAKRGERIDAHELDFDGLEENPRAAEKLITKSNIFGEVDWDGLREKGMSGSTAFLIDRIYASAGSKPDESNAQARKQYVIALNGLRDRFEDCKTVPEVIDTLKEIREEIRGEYVEIKEMPEYKKITDKMKSLRETINDKRIELEILAEQCRRKAQAEQQKVVEKYIQKAKDEKLVRWNTRVSSYNIPEKYKLAFNLEHSKAWSDAWEPHTKAVEDFKQELISKGAKEEDFFRKNDTYGNGTKTYPISWFDYYTLMPEYTELGSLETELDAYVKKMKVAVRLKNPQLEAWKSLGTRFLNILYSDSFAQHKYDCTKGKYDDWGWLEKEVKVTEKKQGKEKKKFEFLVANEITRKGGRTFNITATADLKKAFNLREVQSGNWVLKDPASAEFHVRNAANAFADLADVTGISDDKISLNGRLAMAFGARGTGGRYGAASAHYEPVERVINLTKFRGGGCLGHEWFHAFDNMITSAMTGDNSKSDIYLTNLYHGMTDANKQLLMNYIELKDAALTYTNNYRREQLKHQLEKKGVDMSKVDGFKSTLQIKVQAAFDNLVKAMTTGTADLRMNLEYDGKDYKAMLYNFSDDMLKRYRERFNSYSGSKKPMQLAIVDAGSLDKAVEEINKRFEGFNDSKHLKSKKDWLKLTAAYYDRQPDGNKNGIPLRVSTGKKVSNFLAWANEMDMNENKSYHSTTHEMAARAFSAYLEDTLESMGRKNDYLAYCSDNKYYSSDYKPYPEGEERKRINECFKKLFEVIRSENAIQKSIDFEKAQTKDFSVWHTKDGDIEVQKDANGEWHPVSRTGKKNSRLNDATNNDTSTATTKVGIPVSPQNTSTQTTKNYTRLDKQKSQSAMKYLNKIKTDTIAPREFLIKLKESFGVINLQDSNYITRKTGNKDITLRLSNHNANGEYVRKNESEISIVISLSESKFKNPDKKDIIEYVYKPENLSKEVKDGIIQGLVNWIKTGVYSDSHADSINKSIICHESIDMPDIIFTRDGRLLFKIA